MNPNMHGYVLGGSTQIKMHDPVEAEGLEVCVLVVVYKISEGTI